MADLRRVVLADKFDTCRLYVGRTQFVEAFVQRAKQFEVTNSVTDCRDAKDNQFLELAQSADAEIIISSDTDLTALRPWRGIPILPLSAFLVAVS